MAQVVIEIPDSILSDHQAGIFQEGYHAGLFGKETTGILLPEDVDVFHEGLTAGIAHRSKLAA